MRAWPGLGRSPLQLVGKALGDLRVRCYLNGARFVLMAGHA